MMNVVPSPNNKYGYQLKVFLSKNEKIKPTTIVSINSFLYNINLSEEIKEGDIGLNRVMREQLDINVGNKIKVDIFNGNISNISNIKLLNLSITTPDNKKCIIDEEKLMSLIYSCYLNNILNPKQIFLVDYYGKNLKIVANIETVGYISLDTVINMESNDKFIIIERSKNDLIKNFDFESLGVGGLNNEFQKIVRRAFSSRMYKAEFIEELGIKHIKGILLYGPPGTGKTLLARQISKMLRSKEPIIVNGPEILNKYVGSSEENIRKLFSAAEKEFTEKGNQSDLHVIIFDEIDAICKQRGRGNDSTGVNDSIVNQLLTKMDGIKQLDNILIIGMTNRKDMMDEALLRPGRFEVQVEISLPDEEGRLQIFQIHTKKMKQSNRLDTDVDLNILVEKTKNFSGAEIEGLVKSACSYALFENSNIENNKFLTNEDNIKVSMKHFLKAFNEVFPIFGINEEELKDLRNQEIIDYGIQFRNIYKNIDMTIEKFKNNKLNKFSLLLDGKKGVGKTKIATHFGLKSNFSFFKIISVSQFVGLNESTKIQKIIKIFDDSSKTPSSVIIIDDIETLLEFVPLGMRFNNNLLQVLISLLKQHTKNKLLLITTTNNIDFLRDIGIYNLFNINFTIPLLNNSIELETFIKNYKPNIDIELVDLMIEKINLPVSIDTLIHIFSLCDEDLKDFDDVYQIYETEN